MRNCTQPNCIEPVYYRTAQFCSAHRVDKSHLLYGVWQSMRNRCRSKSNKHYPQYGGRGIAICQEWGTFASFRAWAEQSGYLQGLSIDRIDNDRGYSPENCRWTDQTTQNNNKSDNVIVEFQGKRQTVMEWAREIGLNHYTLRSRLEHGWPVEEALNARLRRVRVRQA